MVEGMYGYGDSRSGANPFGFDSFGNSLAGLGQQSHRAPRSQQQQRLSLVRRASLDAFSCFRESLEGSSAFPVPLFLCAFSSSGEEAVHVLYQVKGNAC